MTLKILTGFSLCIVIFFCAAIYLLREKDTEHPSLRPLSEVKPSSVVHRNIPNPFTSASAPAPTSEVQEADVHFGELQSLPNNKLISAVKAFWRTCRAVNNCERQLQLLGRAVDMNRYSIISEYPEKLVMFNETINYELTSQDLTLEHKVDQVKSAYASVWGALSEELFFDELAFYDQRLALNSLQINSQDLTLEGKLDVFDRWLQGQSNDDSKLNAYNAAKLFFGEALESDQDKTLAPKLAEKYLPAEQAAKEKQRLDRHQFQVGQAQNYQTALLELRQTLMAERNGIFHDLSEADWLEYSEAKLREFKVRFFE